jgi:hypothetical protein
VLRDKLQYLKYFKNMQYCRAASTPKPQMYRGGNKTVGRWLKDRKEKKKEETRAHNAQVHAAVSVAAVAAAVAAVAAATAAASGSGKDDRAARTDMAMASAATLVAAQCVEAAESMGAEREHLEAVIGSAVNVRTPGDIVTVTAAAATGLLFAPHERTIFSILIVDDHVTLFVDCSIERCRHIESKGFEGGVEHRGSDPRRKGYNGRRAPSQAEYAEAAPQAGEQW